MQQIYNVVEKITELYNEENGIQTHDIYNKNNFVSLSYEISSVLKKVSKLKFKRILLHNFYSYSKRITITERYNSNILCKKKDYLLMNCHTTCRTCHDT